MLALGAAKALPQEASLGYEAALEEALGPLPGLGLHGKVEPRSTHGGNSRVQLLTDVSWKAAGYIGTVQLSLSPLSCPHSPTSLPPPPKKNHNQREAGRHNQTNQKEPTWLRKMANAEGCKISRSFAGDGRAPRP